MTWPRELGRPDTKEQVSKGVIDMARTRAIMGSYAKEAYFVSKNRDLLESKDADKKEKSLEPQ